MGTTREPTLLFPWHDLEGHLVGLTTLQSHLHLPPLATVAPTPSPANSAASNEPPREVLETAHESHAINGSSSSSSGTGAAFAEFATRDYPIFGWPLLLKSLLQAEQREKMKGKVNDDDHPEVQKELSRSQLYITSNALDALALYQSTSAPALALAAASLASSVQQLSPPPALALALEPFEHITCWFRPLAAHAHASSAEPEGQEVEAKRLSADRQDFALLRSCMTLLGSDRCDWIRCACAAHCAVWRASNSSELYFVYKFVT